MATIPAVKVSTLKNVERNQTEGELMKAIAAAIKAGDQGGKGLDKIRTKYGAQEKAQHTKDTRKRR